MDPLSRAVSYVGKVDRSRAEEDRLRDLRVFNIKPRTQLEHCCYDNYLKLRAIREGELGNELALQMYLNARSLRHDIWVEMLELTKSRPEFKFGDIRVRDFITQLSKSLKCTMSDMPDDIKNKTPDILLYNPNGRYIVLGDVAVTVAYDQVKKDKYLKYNNILKYFKQNGFNVRWLSLIVKDDLTNIRTILNEFVTASIIDMNDVIIERSSRYHTLMQRVMVDCENKVIDKVMFKKTLAREDKLSDEFDHDVIPEFNVIMDDTEPVISELDLIGQIKDEADRIYESGYFDEGLEKTTAAFNKLKENYSKCKPAKPKSVLKVVSNCHDYTDKTDHDLILDYVTDIATSEKGTLVENEYLLSILPTTRQIKDMKKYKDGEIKEKKTETDTYGPYQYSRTKIFNPLVIDLNNKLSFGKKVKNEKKEPTSIHPDNFNECISFIDNSIEYFGEPSKKLPFLNQEWDAATNLEIECTVEEKQAYDYVRTTNGAQLAHSLSNLYQRILHTKTSYGNRDNIYTPPNGSFIVVMPKEHAPINSKNCDMPFIFITRFKKDYTPKHIEYEFKIEGGIYNYYVSKLCRLNIDKIVCWDQAGYRLTACSSYLLSKAPKLRTVRGKVVGLLTYLMLDGHQKTSEYLDLFKYIAYMPFADISRLSVLIEDKMNIMTKTPLDIWLLHNIESFIKCLTMIDESDAKKPRIKLFNAKIVRESLGLNLSLPSFIDNNVKHDKVEDFVEEITMLNIVRPKHLYGSQFMHKSMNDTASWNAEYEKEVEEHGDWAVNGNGKGDFPFKAKFCFSRDAIIYAQRYFTSRTAIQQRAVSKKLTNTKFFTYMHNNCSLRGCTKNKKYRKNANDLHTTSIEECLTEYESENYKDEKCTTLSMASDFLKSDDIMQFSMSEKDQRGGGRPISTPTLHTKAVLMVIEKPEQAIGTFTPNNVIVEGKNKLKEQSQAYKDLVSAAALEGFKEVYQLTEDQTKWSENDNTRKYKSYIAHNNLLPKEVRAMQYIAMDKLIGREHLVHKLPKSVTEDSKLKTYINHDQNGVKANIGWPQGMLNFISTSIHAHADLWITYAFNLVSQNKVKTSGLVHSDDSWVSVACDSVDTFKRFTIFRMVAKKLFCLKVNEKKLWGSKYLGEMLSNYNINGNVHLPVSKMIANSFCNLMYQNWVIDTHNQVSSLQQAYRSGCTIPTLIMLKTILRQQLLASYQVKGKQAELLYVLPIELGGFPNLSAFELSVNGVNAHYVQLVKLYGQNPNDEPSLIVGKIMTLSILKNKGIDVYEHTLMNKNKIRKYREMDELPFKEEDYESVSIAHRGDVFTAVKHLMPKSSKVNKTIQKIRDIPFEGNGLEMIITRPKELSIALGNFKNQTSTMLYSLASEHYTQSSRRLAISQVIQSSGKVVKVLDFPPMTYNELYKFINDCKTNPASLDNLQVAFADDSDIPEITEVIVNHGEFNTIEPDSRKIINKMPNIEDKFTTIARLSNVLLYIVDEAKSTNYLQVYGNQPEVEELLRSDSDLIKTRFNIYFEIYNVEYACNLIMQQYLYATKNRLWMQPFLRSDSIETFLCDLYGKTLSNSVNFRVELDYTRVRSSGKDSKIINSLYTVLVLNKIYYNKFKPQFIANEHVDDVFNRIDYGTLSSEDYLKYAVISYDMYNNERHLRNYDEKKVYDQYYRKEQRTDASGRYYGDFECVVQYNKTVLLITGEPENISLTVNNTDINSILFAMMLFVKYNFPFYKYNSPNQWSTCGFWKSKDMLSTLFLSTFGSCVTYLTGSRNYGSIPVTVNPTLKMIKTYNKLLGDSYHCDDTLRVVYKKIDNKEIKVASVKQTMSCPMANNIVCIDEFIEGLSNNSLLKNKLIINIMSRKYYENTKDEYKDIIANSLVTFDAAPLFDFYAGLINEFAEIDYDFTKKEEDDIEFEVVNVEDQQISAFITMADSVSPESLEYVETEYYTLESNRVGRIVIQKNLKKLFYKIISGYSTNRDIEEILYVMFKNTVLVEKINDAIVKTNWFDEEILSTIVELKESKICEIPLEVYSFIVGNSLDCPETLNKFDMVKLIESKFYRIKNDQSLNRGNEITRLILDLVYDEDIDRSRTSLLETLRARRHK